jgi:hypothetical protein
MGEAVRLTKQTMEKRAARFRDLVVGVVGLVLLCLLCALFFLSWKPLLGTLLLVPLSGAYLCRDISLVNDWQRGITGLWVHGGLDLDTFATAIRGIPYLPPRMLGGMLDALPTKERGIAGALLTPPLREALAGILDVIGRCQWDGTFLATLGYATGLGSAALAMLQHSWMPLAGLLLVFPIQGAGLWIVTLRFRNMWRRIRTLLAGESDVVAIMNAAGCLDWDPIPPRMKQKLLLPPGSDRPGAPNHGPGVGPIVP